MGTQVYLTAKSKPFPCLCSSLRGAAGQRDCAFTVVSLPMPKPHPRPMKSESLEPRPRHWWVLGLPADSSGQPGYQALLYHKGTSPPRGLSRCAFHSVILFTKPKIKTSALFSSTEPGGRALTGLAVPCSPRSGAALWQEATPSVGRCAGLLRHQLQLS